MVRRICPNPSSTATPASVLFFPQRVKLLIDGSDYSPAVTERIAAMGGTCSFPIAAKMFELLTDLKVASRTINNKSVAVGTELKEKRDAQADTHAARPITAAPHVAEPPVPLAAVQVDGGRIQTRTPSLGRGVHNPHWRESKNAGLFRMVGEIFDEDPHPLLPSCFTSRKQMASLLSGLPEDASQSLSDLPKPDLSWRPESVYRTCVASMCDSDRFGQLMSAEAEQRGLYSADRRAFLGDGLGYNWTIQQTYFETFTPILDFIHPIERLHELSHALWENTEEAWQECQKWMELCWSGDVSEVIGLLEAEQSARQSDAAEANEDDSQRKLEETIGYLRNNVSRMDYPRYRTGGLPTTSCLIESQVKEMNHRVKGSEKLWNDGDSGEAILHLRAALISDGDQLHDHIASRPGNHYTRQSKKDRQLTQP